MRIVVPEIKKYVSIEEKDVEELEASFTRRKILKGHHLIKVGEFCKEIFFIKSGRLRVYYLDEKGNEVTCFFFEENQFVSSYTSFLTNAPTKENIQAIADCEVFTISRDRLDKVSIQIPTLHIFRRIMAENLFIAMERRISMLQSQTAQERYEKTIKETPELILNIPLQYTASFLGITPQHLSRLRKEL